MVARRERRLTQDQLAEQVNLTQADISRIEAKGWIPPMAIQERIAAVLDVGTDELFPVAAWAMHTPRIADKDGV